MLCINTRLYWCYRSDRPDWCYRPDWPDWCYRPDWPDGNRYPGGGGR